MGTFDQDGSLPRVPVPTLHESAGRFLDWCAPLLSAGELEQTRRSVDELLAGDSGADALQQALLDYDAANTEGSWLDAFWRTRYLGRRDRIALNANFAFLFADSAEDQLSRAAGLLTAAVDYLVQVREERLPVAELRGKPLSMEQVRFLFSSARIPGAVQDAVRTPYSADHPGPPTARHVVVLRGGQAYRVDVLGPDGVPYPTEEVRAALAGIPASPDGPAVGHLTTQARARWADNRAKLVALHPANVAALEAIESALLLLCLDDEAPGDPPAAARQLLAGGHGNRWYDKAVSLIVCADGAAGINVEHCLLDGTTILALVDGMLGKTVAEHAAASGACAQGTPRTEHIPFVLDDMLRTEIDSAAAEFTAYADSAATCVLTYADVGADRVKQLGMSPDAFCQLAFQLAHRRARGLTGATYESIATRQWRRGRTEAMRVVTPQMLRFVAVADDASATADDRRSAAQAAARAHVARAQDCQAGRAPEQHLWALQMIQQQRGTEIGAGQPLSIYDSPGWTIMRKDYLSTSSAPSEHIVCFAFGSTSDTCIGVAYLLLPDRLAVHLCAPQSQADQLGRFADELGRALQELRTLLVA